MSSSSPKPKDQPDAIDLEAASASILAAAEKALNEGTTDQISQEAVQRLLTAGARLFANKIEMEEKFFLPFTSREATTAPYFDS